MSVNRKLLGIAVLVVLLLLVPFLVILVKEAKDLEQCKQNLHVLQLALERWNVDNLDFVAANDPTAADFAIVIKDGYLPQTPINPYTRLPMVELKAGEANRPGDYRYLTQVEEHKLSFGRMAVEHCNYVLVVCVKPGSSSRRREPLDSYPLDPTLVARLGDGPVFTLASGVSHWARVGELPELVSSETWPEALTRLGY